MSIEEQIAKQKLRDMESRVHTFVSLVGNTLERIGIHIDECEEEEAKLEIETLREQLSHLSDHAPGLSLGRVQAFEREKEALDALVDNLARQVHVARGKPDLWKEPVQIRWSTISWTMDEWELLGDTVFVKYGFHSQSPDYETVKFPAAFLEEGFAWRSVVENERRQAEEAADLKAEREARSLV